MITSNHDGLTCLVGNGHGTGINDGSDHHYYHRGDGLCFYGYFGCGLMRHCYGFEHYTNFGIGKDTVIKLQKPNKV